MTHKDPFLEGTFWDKFWRPIRSRALLFTPDIFLTVGAFLLTVVLLCLQPLKTLIRRTFPLQAKNSNCK